MTLWPWAKVNGGQRSFFLKRLKNAYFFTIWYISLHFYNYWQKICFIIWKWPWPWLKVKGQRTKKIPCFGQILTGWEISMQLRMRNFIVCMYWHTFKVVTFISNVFLWPRSRSRFTGKLSQVSPYFELQM